MTSSGDGLDGLGRWLAERALQETAVDVLFPLFSSLDALFPAFCDELVRSALPIWRSSLGLEVLHPEVSGFQFVWTDARATITETPRPGVAQSASYRNSPTRVVDETNAPFRRRLDEPAPDMPLLEELRLAGATDYVMFPLPFIDRTRTAVMAFATRADGGFDAGAIGALELAAALFGPYAERHVLRRIAADLLDTYVGPRTGTRIIEGRVERGDVERIEAALWHADLRAFTRYAEHASIEEVIATLNAWLEEMVAVIDEHDGEVLKFMGDAVLAIFPISATRPRRQACGDALAAALAFGGRSDALNAARRAEGRLPLEFGLALHFGEVAYGNIGARRRLDFTVIGPAVNRASRLQELTKELQRQVVMSRAFCSGLDGDFVDLGKHRLRDIERPQRVFGLPEAG